MAEWKRKTVVPWQNCCYSIQITKKLRNVIAGI